MVLFGAMALINPALPSWCKIKKNTFNQLETNLNHEGDTKSIKAMTQKKAI